MARVPEHMLRRPRHFLMPEGKQNLAIVHILRTFEALTRSLKHPAR